MKVFMQEFLKLLVELLDRFSVPLLAYFAGREQVNSAVKDKQLSDAKRFEQIQKDNLAKSSDDILNELLRDDARKEP